ncbi:MAG: hypothetical protein Fur0046_10030 [Cyanobacteria bacterium J069]
MILEEAHVTILAVQPQMRGRGLGQLLLTALMQAAWQREMSWATLEVRASNQQAIALYRKFGFAEVGLRPRYYQNPTEDALILWRKGLQNQEFGETLRMWWKWVGDRHSQQNWQLTLDQNMADFRPLPLDTGIFS